MGSETMRKRVGAVRVRVLARAGDRSKNVRLGSSQEAGGDSPAPCEFELRRPAQVAGLAEAGAPADAATEQAAAPAAEEDRTAAWRRKRREEADALWKKFLADRNETNRNALVVHYLPFVRAIADRIKSKLPENVDLGDLISAGTLGLLDAIAKFEPTLGVRFETYCMSRTKGSILDYIRSNDWVPRLIRTRGHERDRAIAALTARLKREPTDGEVARAMGMTQEEYEKLLKQLDVRAQVSVEGCAGEGHAKGIREGMRLEMLEDPHRQDPGQEAFLREFREMAPRGLNENERYVLEQYYFKHRTMKEIGDSLLLSESRVCQIHIQLLAFLRGKFKSLAAEYGIGGGAETQAPQE